MNTFYIDRAALHHTQRGWLLRLSRTGTLLSLAILSASVVLRLKSVIDANGHAVSLLDPDTEYAIRLLHRLSATRAGLITLTVLILSWRLRDTGLRVCKPALCIAFSVLLLSIIGPLTSGYMYGGITVLNVLAGMLMLMAFWWLSETIATSDQTLQTGQQPDAVHPVFLWLMLHIASGAAASAWYMVGMHWPVLLHLLTLAPLLALAGRKSTKPNTQAGLTGFALAAGLVAGLQLVSGGVLLWQAQRTFAANLLHAVSAYLLMLLLVTSSMRSGAASKPDAS